ncbi:helicase [Hamiltosporidium magnivora]|uniref:Helicase n=1 Tax=Hamiltosporidium magnivora TaxID=148818 RepID=A0A4Q9LEN1_9MICR|nr:helicase [Hamiltosporidium magnivora]
MTLCENENKIYSLINDGIKNNYRSVFVVLGSNCNEVSIKLHHILSKTRIGIKPSVLWCYKREMTGKNYKKKKMANLSNQVKSGMVVEEDAFEVFNSSTNVDYILYGECDRVLGRTYDMCVLQDFDCITPNIMAKTVETVCGGGLIIFLLENIYKLEDAFEMKMDIHKKFGDLENEKMRFNKRLFCSLKKSKFTIFLNENMEVLNISKYKSKKNELIRKENIEMENKSKKCKESSSGSKKYKFMNGLITKDVFKENEKIEKTKEQRNLLVELEKIYSDRNNKTIISVTAARGRGKSALLGFSISDAIKNHFGVINVVAPALENVKTLFLFVENGLKELNFEKNKDYQIYFTKINNKKFVSKISITKYFKQIIEYVDPRIGLKLYPDLVVVDEAAAIPMSFLKPFLECNVVLMASTLNGYEGTGRSLSLKLFETLRKNSKSKDSYIFKEFILNESIRYSRNDPVERWLYDVLLLDAQPPKITFCPPPENCELAYVDRDILFSYHSASEIFLNEIVSLFVASHYKNSPNDLQLLADGPKQGIFVLLTPLDDKSVEGKENANCSILPKIICAIQVTLEGKIKNTQTVSKDGNLIPWTVYEHFIDTEFINKSGIRIVRIAVHPDFINMGYGSRALDLFCRFFSEQNSSENNFFIPKNTMKKSLLYSLKDILIPKIEWIGSSFGVTSHLLFFWKKLNFLQIYLKQTPSKITGEHSVIVIKDIHDNNTWIYDYYNIFISKFINLLSYNYKDLDPVLSLSLYYDKNLTKFKDENIKIKNYFSCFDIKRIEIYCKNRIDIKMIMDLLPIISFLYFKGKFTFNLDILQESLLLIVGLQRKDLCFASSIFKLDSSHINSIFLKIISLLFSEIFKMYQNE